MNLLSKRNITIASLALIAIFSVFILNRPSSNVPIVKSHGDSVIDMNDISQIIGFHDYIFEGTVTGHLGDFYDGHLLPYNRYSVEVTDNFKGKLSKSIEITKEGGSRTVQGEKTLILLADTLKGQADFLPEVGKTYIFIGSANWNGELEVRFAAGNMTIDLAKTIFDAELYKGDLKKAIQEAIKNETKYTRERVKAKYQLDE